MKYLSIITLLACLCGCSRKLIGHYSSSKAGVYFEFKGDSTFRYEHRVYHSYEYATGRWSIDDAGQLRLNSFFKDSTINFSVKEKELLDSGKSIININLDVKNGLKISDYYCQIYVNGLPNSLKNFPQGIRCDSITGLIIGKRIDSVQFFIQRNPANPSSTAIPHAIASNQYKPAKAYALMDIEMSFNDSLFFYHVFTNEKVLLRRNRIKIYDKSYQRWESIRKVSDSAKNMLYPNLD